MKAERDLVVAFHLLRKILDGESLDWIDLTGDYLALDGEIRLTSEELNLVEEMMRKDES